MSLGFQGEMPVLRCGKSRVKNEFKKRADINDIVKRYLRTGSFDTANQQAPVFADVSAMGDFHSICAKVRLAEESFEALPSAIRTRFENDPRQLIAFIQDAKNRPEAIKLGLIVPPPEEPVVPATPAASKPPVTTPASPGKGPNPAPEVPPTA